MVCYNTVIITICGDRMVGVTVKILVLSDSHAALSFMRRCVMKINPQAVIHLGDFYDDAQALQEDFPHIPFHIVPGNCDRYRCPLDAREVLCYHVGGVRLFMTHGHIHRVKTGIGGLLADARRFEAAAALYGHTHIADCHIEQDGLWVLNPGTCGHYGGSAGVIETDGNKITACRIIRQSDLEDIL